MGPPMITVNGRQYPLVRIDELTLDEAIVFWEYTKLGLDQVGDLEGFHPGVTAALIHVSVARGEPGETTRSVRAIVGKLPLAELATVFSNVSEEVGDEAVPPPSESSPNAASGAGSSPTTAPHQERSRANGSGSPGTDTGSTSAPLTSAA